MARPGTAAWFAQQEAARAQEDDQDAAAAARRAQYIARGGSARGIPLSDPIWQNEFLGNPRARLMPGGRAPRGVFPGFEEAEAYISTSANLSRSTAWLMLENQYGDIELYISDESP